MLRRFSIVGRDKKKEKELQQEKNDNSDVYFQLSWSAVFVLLLLFGMPLGKNGMKQTIDELDNIWIRDRICCNTMIAVIISYAFA